MVNQQRDGYAPPKPFERKARALNWGNVYSPAPFLFACSVFVLFAMQRLHRLWAAPVKSRKSCSVFLTSSSVRSAPPHCPSTTPSAVSVAVGGRDTPLAALSWAAAVVASATVTTVSLSCNSADDDVSG